MKIKKSDLLRVFGREKGQALAGLYSHMALPDRQKILGTAACLQALGESRHLTAWLELALTDPKALAPIYEVLLQGYLFCGYPRAIESFFCLERAVERNRLSLDRIVATPLDSSETLQERGRRTASAIHRGKFERIHNKISAISPDLGYLMIAEGYGHILCRPGLDLRTRELAVVSCLTSLGAMRQLNSHIRGALNVGCSAVGAFEAIFLCLPWLGADGVRRAVDAWAAITGGDVDALVSAYNWL